MIERPKSFLPVWSNDAIVKPIERRVVGATLKLLKGIAKHRVANRMALFGFGAGVGYRLVSIGLNSIDSASSKVLRTGSSVRIPDTVGIRGSTYQSNVTNVTAVSTEISIWDASVSAQASIHGSVSVRVS